MTLRLWVVLGSGGRVAANYQEAAPLYALKDGARLEMQPPPELNFGFSELQEVFFFGPPTDKYRLLVDDGPLVPVMNGDRFGWVWKPGFYAGEVRAELTSGDGRKLCSWRLDVSPDETKLGRDRFAEMLADVLVFDPSLIVGQESARLRFGALGRNQDPLVALARLRTHEQMLQQSLKAILREPARTLRSRRNLVPLHQIRRADRQTAVAALNQPMLLAAMGRLGHIKAPGSARDLRANVPDVERHFDSPANRCSLAMIHALLRRCSDVAEVLKLKVEHERDSDTVTSLRHRWRTWESFLQMMRQELLSVSRCRPFCEVSRAEITAAGLNAISAHPLYSRFWRLAWEALRTGVKGIEQEELLPMNPTWELYERWCFVELQRQLQSQLPGLTWTRVRNGNLEGSSSEGTRVRLQLQPSFGSTSGKPQDGGFWSVSGQRLPDIVLSWTGPEDSGFVVLDAKYRVARRNVLDAMSSAHIYQDSLRMGCKRPACSVLLVPDTCGAPWLEEADFVTKNKVGIAGLQPGGELPTWLSSIFKQVLISNQS